MVACAALESRTLFAALPIELRAWAGAAPLVDAQARPFEAAGHVAAAGARFVGGGTQAAGAIDFDHTADDALFAMGRAGAAFTFDAPLANGEYVVFVEFADGRAGGLAGENVFGITAEGATLAAGVDPVALAGGRTQVALAVGGHVTVADGRLDLAFAATAGAANVSAVVAVPTQVDAAALPYAPANTSETSRVVVSASNLRQIGMGLLLDMNENRGAYPADVSKIVRDQDVPADAFVSPRAATLVPRGATTLVEQVALARSLNDYVYIQPPRISHEPTRIVAYENPNRVAGDLNVLYADGHVALVSRAALAATVGFDANVPPASARPAPLGLQRDAATDASASNVRRILQALVEYGSYNRRYLPLTLGELATKGFLTDAAAFLSPRLGRAAPDTTGWTDAQIGAWVDANTSYGLARTASPTQSINSFDPVDPLVYERVDDLNAGRLSGGLVVGFGDGSAEFQESRWARQTLAVVPDAATFATLDAATGVLHVAGTVGDDTIAVANAANQQVVVTMGGVARTFAFQQVAAVMVDGGLGDDSLDVGTALSRPTYFAGGAGSNALAVNGAESGETLVLSDGRVTAFRNDVTYAGVGALLVNGRGGSDTIRVDEVTPNARVTLDGGAGDDSILARDGAGETIVGGDGNDGAYVDYLERPVAQRDVYSGVEVLRDSAINLSTSSLTPNEGDLFTLSLGYHFGQRPTSWTIDWGDGSAPLTLPGTATTASHAFDGPLAPEVVVTATHHVDVTDEAIVVPFVQNVAPRATFGPTVVGAAGSLTTLAFTGIIEPSAADVAAGLRFIIDFDGNGSFNDPGDVIRGTSANVSYTYRAPGTFTARGIVFDKDGASTAYTATVVVAAPPTSPLTIGVDDPVVYEGTPATLSGFAYPLATGQSIASWQWDFTYDGTTFDVDATGRLPTFLADDGPATRQIGLRVTDNFGAVTTRALPITVRNLAPRASFVAPATVYAGQLAAFSFINVKDASAADTAAGFYYDFDFNLDGDYTDAGDVLNGRSPTANASFATSGSRRIGGRIRDKDGGSVEFTVLFNVLAAPAPPTAVGFDNNVANEGAATTLNGFASPLASGQTIQSWHWDLDYDGVTFDFNATGQRPVTTFADGPGTRTIALRVTDNYGQVVTRSQSLTIRNVAPTATFTGGSAELDSGGTDVRFAAPNDPSSADRVAGFKYSYDFNNDGDYTDSIDRFESPFASVGVAFSTVGTRTIRGRITDKDGGFTEYTTTVTVTPPTALKATMLYVDRVAEGASATFNGSATLPPGRTVAKYEWDFDYVGGVFTADAATANATFSAAGLDGPTIRLVALRVTDSTGATALATGLVTVTNAAPTATLALVANADGSATATVSGATDASAADRAAGFKYSFDFNGDGDFVDAGDVLDSTSPTAAFRYAASGTYAINVRVADKDGGALSLAKSVAVTVPTTTPGTKLGGAPLGTAGSFGNSGNTIVKALDGDLNTFFDSNVAGGAWVGLDLGTAKAIGSIKFAPRGGWPGRMTGGVFQGSNDPGFAGAVTLGTIATAPATGTLTTLASSSATAFRYVRYLAPANSYGNVAEVQFFAADGPTTPPPTTGGTLAGTPIGTAGSFGNSGNTFAKVFDGSLSTYFDSTVASGAWAGLDLGTAKSVTGVRFAPRSGWATRMIGGRFEGSDDPGFAGATTLGTIAAAPPVGSLTTLTFATAGSYRFVRYVAPANGYGNVAEVQFLGGTGTTPPPAPTFTKLSGATIGTAGSFGGSANTIAKALDGDLNSYYDGATASSNWVGLDLGTATVIRQVAFAPRGGWAGRMAGGVFQSSNDPGFAGATTLYTVAAPPPAGALTTAAVNVATAFRYVRYLAPANSWGNVAEVAFYR